MRAIIACCVFVAMACRAFAEEPAADEPIEITFEGLELTELYDRDKLPELITSIEGKLIRIVGWSSGYPTKRAPRFNLRPDLGIPNWEPPFSVTATVEPYDETAFPPPHAQLEVTGTFVLHELRDEHDRVCSAYRIKNAKFKVLQESYD